MSKTHYTNIIEESSKDIELIQENLNELRIQTDDNGVEETKNDKDASDNSVDNLTENLTDIENESEIEKPWKERLKNGRSKKKNQAVNLKMTSLFVEKVQKKDILLIIIIMVIHHNKHRPQS